MAGFFASFWHFFAFGGPACPAGARPVVVDMPAAEAPADAAGEPAEAAEDPKDAADSAEETAEDADAAKDAETPEPPEIAIARPDAAQPAVQPGIAAPAIQPGGISVMLPGETRQVALNTQASNEDGTVMGDFETVVKNAKAGQEIILQEDYIGSTVVISGNTAGQLGGGIYADNGVTVRLAGYLLNNHAGTAGADLYLTAGSAEDKNRNVLILRRVSKDDDWTLVDCGHTIDGWYIDGDEDGNNRWNADATVDADGNEIPKFIMNLDTLLDGSDYTILQDENGDYVITVGGKALALKAAHAVISPEPTPDPEPTPGPNPTPDPEPTPITPETPESPEVPEAPGETPVTPISTPAQTVAPSGTHLPQTGTSLFAALAMALSGIALTAAGAWASLTGRRCRH